MVGQADVPAAGEAGAGKTYAVYIEIDYSSLNPFKAAMAGQYGLPGS